MSIVAGLCPRFFSVVYGLQFFLLSCATVPLSYCEDIKILVFFSFQQRRADQNYCLELGQWWPLRVGTVLPNQIIFNPIFQTKYLPDPLPGTGPKMASSGGYSVTKPNIFQDNNPNQIFEITIDWTWANDGLYLGRYCTVLLNQINFQPIIPNQIFTKNIVRKWANDGLLGV